MITYKTKVIIYEALSTLIKTNNEIDHYLETTVSDYHNLQSTSL